MKGRSEKLGKKGSRKCSFYSLSVFVILCAVLWIFSGIHSSPTYAVVVLQGSDTVTGTIYFAVSNIYSLSVESLIMGTL